MEACQSCHGGIYNTFINTGMGKSFNVASKQKSAAKFGKHHVVVDKFTHLSYYPFWRNDTMYIMEFRVLNNDTVHKRIERVDYIIGSGQHTNSHLTNINGYIYQLPLTWYAQKGKWDLPPGFEGGQNVRFNRAIGLECMSCHNAMPSFEENSENKFTSVPMGINCERCHGPGEIHVREKLAGKIVDTATLIDYTIVNPKKLSWELQIDVCQRCHLQGNVVLKNNKSFTDFRPGQKLSDYMDIFMPKYHGGDDEFIMASHAQRLQQSKCFLAGQKNNKPLTCISCHNPHISVEVTGKQVFNNACNNCHSQAQQNFCSASPQQLAKANNNCVQCHMPKSGTVDIPHVTVTDHWIKKPATATSKNKLKSFVGIYCINNPQTDNETKAKANIAYTEKFSGALTSLDTAKKLLTNNQNDDVLLHLWYLKGNYADILKKASTLKPLQQNKPWLCYRIGRTYFNQNNYTLATLWYKQAIKLAPQNLNFLNALGATYVETDNFSEAENILNTSLQKNPKQAEPLVNLGYLFAKKQQYQMAVNYYKKAIALDPYSEQALLNLAAAYMQLNNKTAAAKTAKQVLTINPKNALAKQILGF